MKVITYKDNKSELVKVEPKEFLETAASRWPHPVNVYNNYGSPIKIVGWMMQDTEPYIDEYGRHFDEIYRVRRYAIDNKGRRTPPLPDNYAFVPHELLPLMDFPCDFFCVYVGPDEAPDYKWIGELTYFAPDDISEDMVIAVEIGSEEFDSIATTNYEYLSPTKE